MNNEIQLLLVPTPGAKPEFLATIQPVGKNEEDSMVELYSIWDLVGTKIILEGYTRDGWAWKPSSDTTIWTTLTTESTDGRNKLPGFVKYLKERQKSAYGRFGATGVWVVSYVQSHLGDGANTTRPRVDVRIALDGTKIPNCTLAIKRSVPELPQLPHLYPAYITVKTRSTNHESQLTTIGSTGAPTPITTTTTRKPPSGGGLLGKLVGAQQRTNQCVAIAAAAKAQPLAAHRATIGAVNGGHNPLVSSISFKTVPEVFAAFRTSCQAQMLDFDMSNDEILKVPIHMKEQLQWLATDEEKSKVTMDVLKYMIYEAAEEVNEEWVAHKEPSEYMDEVVIAVYKEGAAPPEVLEEVNKGELPDEIRGQQRALQEQRMRQVSQKQKNGGALAAPNLNDDEEDEDFEALNTKKRDRRTVADYERERMMESTSKRSR